MGAPRKNPPPNINELIEQYVAGEGGSSVILARAIGVSDSTVRRWFQDDEMLKEAYDAAREAHMHKLYLELIQMSRAGKGNVAGIIFTLKARFKQFDQPGPGKLVDVNVNNAPTNVLVIKEHGTVEEWKAKVAAQQRALTQGTSAQPQLQAPRGAQIAPGAFAASPADVPLVQTPRTPTAPVFEPPVWRGNA